MKINKKLSFEQLVTKAHKDITNKTSTDWLYSIELDQSEINRILDIANKLYRARKTLEKDNG